MKKITNKPSERSNFVNGLVLELMSGFDKESLNELKEFETGVKLKDLLSEIEQKLKTLNSKTFWDDNVIKPWMELTNKTSILKEFESRENLKRSELFTDLLDLYNVVFNHSFPNAYVKSTILALFDVRSSRSSSLPKEVSDALFYYEYDDNPSRGVFVQKLFENLKLFKFVKTMNEVSAIKLQLNLYYDPKQNKLLLSKKDLKAKFIKVSTLTFSESNKKNYVSKNLKGYLESKEKDSFLIEMIKKELNKFYIKQLEVGALDNSKMTDFVSGKVPFSFVTSDADVIDWMSKTKTSSLKSAYSRIHTESDRERFCKLLDDFLKN